MKKLGLVIAMAAMTLFAYVPTPAHADFLFSVRIAPPALPVYEQPEMPGADYLWTPGYWSYDDEVEDYYWVPGAWVAAPEPGLLWTPGYWGYHDGVYGFSEGYWGPTVGFYGGVAYGFGYTGSGFYGGRWQGNSFYYNRSVTNINTTIVQNNVYNQTVVVNKITNVSYNGGTGGTRVKATQAELAAASLKTQGPTNDQAGHRSAASTLPSQRFSTNKGNPTVVATPRAGLLSGPGVVSGKAVNTTTGGQRTGSSNLVQGAGTPTSSPRTGGAVDTNKKRQQNASTGTITKKATSDGTPDRGKTDKTTKTVKAGDTGSRTSGNGNATANSPIKTGTSTSTARNNQTVGVSSGGNPPGEKTNNRSAPRTTNASNQPMHHPNNRPAVRNQGGGQAQTNRKKPDTKKPDTKKPEEKRG